MFLVGRKSGCCMCKLARIEFDRVSHASPGLNQCFFGLHSLLMTVVELLIAITYDSCVSA